MTHRRIPRSRSSRRRPPLGQHFLADPRIRRQIIEQLRCRPGDCWLEIGAGHGEMTVLLAESGAQVAAVERDPQLAATLRQRLAEHPEVRVLQADILKVSLGELAREAGCPRWRIYGNLPYYITSPILHHLFAASDAVTDVHVVVQREVADRLSARPGSRDYGYLSVVTQFHTTPEILQGIPRGAFRPTPQVDSVLVWLQPPGRQAKLRMGDPEAFLRFVGACFRQKRKTLFNNLRSLYPGERVRAALARNELPLRARAEELPVEVLAQLFRALRPPPGSVVPPQSL